MDAGAHAGRHVGEAIGERIRSGIESRIKSKIKSESKSKAAAVNSPLAYLAAVRKIMTHLETTQMPAIARAADLIAQAFKRRVFSKRVCAALTDGYGGFSLHLDDPCCEREAIAIQPVHHAAGCGVVSQ